MLQGDDETMARLQIYGPMIAARDFGWMCAYCYRPLVPVVRRAEQWGECDQIIRDKTAACIDHVVPVSRGGPDHIDNYVLACRECNSRKRDRLPGEYSIIRS